MVEDDQLVPLERAAQLALQHQSFDRSGIHAGYVEGAGIAAILFRVIHRRIGIADQVDHIFSVIGTDRDSGAGGQVNLLLVYIKGSADFIEQRAGETPQGLAVIAIQRQIVDEHGELVARQAADHRVLAQIPRKPLAQDLERAIAGGMAEGVVDLLEPIQVQVQQCERALVAPRTRNRLLQQMLELHAVRHFRERVVARQVADTALGAFAFRDIARHINIALKLRIFRIDR